MVIKKTPIKTEYKLSDFDYDGDEALKEEKEDIETEYTLDDFEDEEEFDSDHDFSDD